MTISNESHHNDHVNTREPQHDHHEIEAATKTFSTGDSRMTISNESHHNDHEIEAATKTFSTWDSRMVTHCSTNQAISSLNVAERTGCIIFLKSMAECEG